MTDRNLHALCGPCRDEPDALSPCPCHHSPCLHDRNKTIADLREQLTTLRSVSTTDVPGQTVCVDPDCPYPEHEGDCPSPNAAQWEHMARLRMRRLNVLHRWLHERDEVIAQQNASLSAKYEYDVYAISNCERTPTRIGFARSIGEDGQVQTRNSILVHLDALPVSGQLTLRKRREVP